MNIVSLIKGGKIPLGYSMLDTGHPGKHSGITPGCIFPCFLPENIPQCILHTHAHPHDIAAAKTMLPSGRAYPKAYCVQK